MGNNQRKSNKSEIYYGEDLNDTLTPSDWRSVILLDQNKALLQDRLSLPIKIMERLPIQEILETPAGEQVLDFGQNQTGWMEFYNRNPKAQNLFFKWEKSYRRVTFIAKIYVKQRPLLSIFLTVKKNGFLASLSTAIVM